MIFNKRHIFNLLMVLTAGIFITSCTDDKLAPQDPSTEPIESEGETIAFTLSLPVMTRANSISEFEKFENVIDYEKVAIMFFYADKDEQGNPKENYNTLIRMFTGKQNDGYGDLFFIPIESSEDRSVLNWYVKLGDVDTDFANELRTHNFKVAALVNWNLTNVKSRFKGPIKNDGVVTRWGTNINSLHHLTNANDQYSEKDGVYGFLLKDGKDNGMGLYEEWVDTKQNKQGGANETIRKDWYPGCTSDPDNPFYLKNYYDQESKQTLPTYIDLRLLWNFHGAYKGDLEEYSSGHRQEWKTQNETDFKEWLSKTNATTKLEDLGPLTSDNGEFQFIGKENGASAYRDDEGGKTGIVLPAGTYTENVIKFKFPASGTLTVTWTKVDQSAGLALERRNHDDMSDHTKRYTTSTQGEWTINETIKITGDSEFGYLYATGGRAKIIAIDYIEDEYLYQTDREGIPLGEDKLIPMYGVQEYRKLEGYWRYGTLFNLSDFNNLSLLESQYPDYQKISLLRSVAKVELLLPKTFNAHHVYLRSANHTSRNEPMDVSTPTNQIWVDNNEDGSHNANCEWSKLTKDKSLVSFYEPDGSADDYQKKLAWYYGSWDVNNGDYISANSHGYSDGQYPQIINPMINRSDFIHFIPTGEYGGIYDRYVLYVPEKFVDDPNDITKDNLTTQSPKVCHIEFRRGTQKDNPEMRPDPTVNLDDNNCYRVYFTEKGVAVEPNQYPTFGKIPEYDENGDILTDEEGNNVYTSETWTWENTYENDPAILAKHWPIIRNHVYSFTVQDATNKIVVVKLEVLPWKDTPQNIYNW